LAKNPVLRKSPYAGMLVNGQGRPVNLHSTINTLTASMGGNKTPIIDENALRTDSKPWIEEYHQRLMDGQSAEDVAPAHLRRLTVTEAALLQTFPSSFAFEGPQSSKFRQIGNAVPPKLAESVAVALKLALSQ
jgi:DNA (cytosine-5)-methyltransferase 1